MDAIEFVKQLRRMDENGVPKDRFVYPCIGRETDSPEDVVAEVEEWAKEHPRKTRQSKLLNLFPDSQINNGYLFCPQMVNYRYEPEGGCGRTKGFDCRRGFWGQEVD